MRDQEYKAKSFRLNDETIKNLEELRKELNLSWNLLFVELLKNYDETLRKVFRK